MTAPEFSGIITSRAALIGACGSVLAVILGLKNSRNIEKVHQATNGMKTELVRVTGDAKFAEGREQGEENPRQHRNHKPHE